MGAEFSGAMQVEEEMRRFEVEEEEDSWLLSAIAQEAGKPVNGGGLLER